MRDSVLQRADELERSLTEAVRNATRAGTASETERIQRLQQLTTELVETEAVAERLAALRHEVVVAHG
jgi:hypothetical protein